MSRIFVLSPAYCGGERAQLLLRKEAQFALAHCLRSEPGAPLGELFTFASGLYFRGKLVYGQAFARPCVGAPAVAIITPTRGLLLPETRVRLEQFQEFASVDIGLSDDRFRQPLIQTAKDLSAQLDRSCEVVFLGSIASAKYSEILISIFGERLRFPVDFVGRGDLSRGGLLLRCVAERRELKYVSLSGAVRHGTRPPRLPPLKP
jgi:hypothetical protein